MSNSHPYYTKAQLKNALLSRARKLRHAYPAINTKPDPEIEKMRKKVEAFDRRYHRKVAQGRKVIGKRYEEITDAILAGKDHNDILKMIENLEGMVEE